MKMNNILKVSLLVFPLLLGCGSSKTSSTPSGSSEEPKPEEISVVILAGQSNMEGNTWSQYVSTDYGFSEEEVTRIREGYNDLKMSYRCFWNGWRLPPNLKDRQTKGRRDGRTHQGAVREAGGGFARCRVSAQGA